VITVQQLPSSSDLNSILTKETDLSPSVISVLTGIWINSENKPIKPFLNLPKLISLSWKLGVTVTSASSSTVSNSPQSNSSPSGNLPSVAASNPAVPFVTLQLTIGDRGTVRTETLDLTLSQLQEFSGAIHDIQQQLQTI